MTTRRNFLRYLGLGAGAAVVAPAAVASAAVAKQKYAHGGIVGLRASEIPAILPPGPNSASRICTRDGKTFIDFSNGTIQLSDPIWKASYMADGANARVEFDGGELVDG